MDKLLQDVINAVETQNKNNFSFNIFEIGLIPIGLFGGIGIGMIFERIRK